MSGSGGAGLVGGALLMDAFEDHEDRVEEQAYDQGKSLATGVFGTYLNIQQGTTMVTIIIVTMAAVISEEAGKRHAWLGNANARLQVLGA